MSTISDTRVVEPYLFFNGCCEEAMTFYSKTLGAKIEMMMRYKDSPEPPPPGTVPPGYEDKIMHTGFRVGPVSVMASDDCSGEQAAFRGFSLSISVHTEAEADRIFNALSESGKVRMPMTRTFWSPRFGMLEDRFGVSWMVNVIPEEEQK